ncbi:MAG: type II secretion system F family protein [Novosphingobium sp.]|nr:type II secretion system F family protein [Novosphingobium sp.]
MPAFAYQAVDATGRRHKGVIQASSAAGARRELRVRALLPISVAPNRAPEDSSGSDTGLNLTVRLRRNRVSSRQLSTATRQLATMIGSDVRIEEALRLVSLQSGGSFGAILLEVREQVLEGMAFAASLTRHHRAFPEFYRAAIHAGEQSGRLPEVLAYLADYVEARHRAKQKVQLALLYPSLLAAVSALMMTAMMIYVVPDITRVFVSRGADLPLLTRLLIGLSNFLARFGLALLGAVAVLAVFTTRWLRRPEQRLALDAFLATRRPFRHFSQQANSARFTATLATLVLSAVPLLDALKAAAAVIPNRYIRGEVDAVAVRVREGESLQRALAQASVFPRMVIALVASGENSGRLGSALGKAANELDRDVEAQVGVLVSLVEPAVLLVMGGLVLLMVLAILLPIISLNDLAVS